MDVGRHPRIRLLAYSEVEGVEGELGNFRVTVRKKARYVDENKCTGCGSCAEKCPTVVSDAYNMGLGKAKSIYKYFAQGIPSAYTIDATKCRNFQPGKKCGLCAKICQAGAIDYKQEDQIIDVEAGAIILATGYELFDARKVPEYGYGRHAQRGYGPGVRAVSFRKRSDSRPRLSAFGPCRRSHDTRAGKGSSRSLAGNSKSSKRLSDDL